MDEDNTSTEATDVAEPTNDDVLNIFNDTESTAEAKAEPDTEETKDEVTEPEVEAEAEAEQPEETESEENQEESEEPDPKEEARRRYEERQKAIQERRQRIQEQNKEYLENSTDEYDQRLRNMEVQQYSAVVENNENTLIGEFERAKANPDLQIFNPENKEMFNEKAYTKAMKDFNAGYIQYDEYQNMIQIKGSLFEHLTETAELLQGAVKSGAVQQVKATRNMQKSADSKPAAPPKETVKDPLLEIFQSD